MRRSDVFGLPSAHTRDRQRGVNRERHGSWVHGYVEFYGTGDETESIASIHAAVDAGIDLLDPADMYGPFTNEKVVGRAIAGRREEVVLATKFGNERNPDGSRVGINGRPGYVRKAADASLSWLGVRHIDLCLGSLVHAAAGPWR